MNFEENNSLKWILVRIDSYLQDIKTKSQLSQKEGDKIEYILFSLPPVTYDYTAPLVVKLERLKYGSFSAIQLEDVCELAARIEETIYYILIEFGKIINGWNFVIQDEAIHKLKLLADRLDEIEID